MPVLEAKENLTTAFLSRLKFKLLSTLSPTNGSLPRCASIENGVGFFRLFYAAAAAPTGDTKKF